MTKVTIDGKDYTACLSGSVTVEFFNNHEKSIYLRQGTLHLKNTDVERFPIGAIIEVTAQNTPTLQFAIVTDTSTEAAPHTKDWGFSHTITFA
ncbi:MAG: hypothetical protein K2K13_05830 [Clostridiales bacterium]|nr:hypothetical protein [Clostridiales bacterium]